MSGQRINPSTMSRSLRTFLWLWIIAVEATFVQQTSAVRVLCQTVSHVQDAYAEIGVLQYLSDP